jgi:hypothetical protein
MDEKTRDALRAPFAPELIGKRPQPTCKQCSDAQDRVCPNHRKSKCDECGQYMTNAHIHLDFVGHADITDRLLTVDPDWSWEPVERAIDPQVLAAAVATGNPDMVTAILQSAPPRIGQDGTLWIRLTVGGVTRLGFGDALGKRGPNAVKEAIGDALRNAAMRFGAGLDMWRKEAPDSDSDTRSSGSPADSPAPAKPSPDPSWAEGYRTQFTEASNADALNVIAKRMKAESTAFAALPDNYQNVWDFGLARYNEMNGASA